MQSIDLSGQWRFTPDGGETTTITVPGFWEAAGHLDLDGGATYEREVHAPAAEFASLEFDAVADLCTVRLNGVDIGGHDVGFTPFTLDASGIVREGSNRLEVHVEDPPLGAPLHLQGVQGKQGWGNRVFPSPPSLYMTYGGIWQPCRLVVHGPLYLDDLWCDLDPDEPWVGCTVANRSETDLAGQVLVRAFGQETALAIEVPARRSADVGTHFRGEGLARWSPASPARHSVGAVVIVNGVPSHRRELHTGLRRIDRDGDDLLIDGQPFRMRSALHQGFWPQGLYLADPELIDRELQLARDAGLNMLRPHLKAFEPAWLDAADRFGMLLQCDTPIGEPVEDSEVRPGSAFATRCLQALREQIKRDRSRPAIVMWTLTNELGLGLSNVARKELESGGVTLTEVMWRLMNEEGLRRAELIQSPEYAGFIAELWDEACRLDPTRPIVENDFIGLRRELIRSDIRTPHWYGRATREFLHALDGRLERLSRESGPVYVTEFGEWGLGTTEGGGEFWRQEDDLRQLVEEAGWPASYDDFALGTQRHQGWADRLQGERLRTSPEVLGFCVTEWTDVPHELNGLVSLTRRPKQATIDGFRPALADVAPIALLPRFAFAAGERFAVDVRVSNWSGEDLLGGEVCIRFGDQEVTLPMAPVRAGRVASLGSVDLEARVVGHHPLVVEVGDAVGAASYDLLVVEPATPCSVDVRGSTELAEALTEAGWEAAGGPVVVVPEGAVTDADAARRIEAEAAAGAVVVVLANDVVPGFGEAAPLNPHWGPTPYPLTTDDLFSVPAAHVLGPELFHCAPQSHLAGVRGPVEVVVPPPTRAWGALVAKKRVGHGSVTACQLRIERGIRDGNRFDLALLRWVVSVALARDDRSGLLTP